MCNVRYTGHVAELDPPTRKPGAAKRETTIGIRISEAGLKALDELAEQEQRTRSDMVRILLREGMEARARRGGRR